MCLILYFMWFWGKNRSFLRSGGDKRVKVWRNGLRPLKEVKRSSQISPKGKKRVVAKPCQKATTRRSTIGVQNKSDESSLICHDSSHIYWYVQNILEAMRRVISNLPRLVANSLKSYTPGSSKATTHRSRCHESSPSGQVPFSCTLMVTFWSHYK